MTMDDPPDPGAGLTRRVAAGAAWIAGGSFLMRFIGLFNTLILARLLTPDDFGVIAIGVTIMQLLQNISDFGVSHAVIRFRNADRPEFDTLFTLSAIRGMFLMLVMTGLALISEIIYHDHRHAEVFVCLGAISLLQALLNPRFYEFQRNLDFSKEFLLLLADKVVTVVVSIAFAALFRSYWAIVAGLAAGMIVRIAISYAARPYLPRFGLPAFASVFSFAGWVTGVSFIVALNNKLDVLFAGRFLDPSSVGAFYVGGQLAYLPSGELAQPIARALYPGFSTLQDNPGRMRAAYLRGAEVLAAIALPAGVGAAFVAHDLVALLLGEQWGAAVPFVQWYAPVSGVAAAVSATHAFAMAQGATRSMFWRELVYFLIRTPVFVYSVIHYGLIGGIIAVSMLELVKTALLASLYAGVARDNIFKPFLAFRRSAAALAGIVLWFEGLRPFAGWIDAAPLAARLGIDVVMAAAFYLAIHFALWLRAGRPAGVEQLALTLTGDIARKISSRR